MNDPIVVWIYSHWGLSIFGLSAILVFGRGYAWFRGTETSDNVHFVRGLIVSLIGVAMWIDFLIRALGGMR